MNDVEAVLRQCRLPQYYPKLMAASITSFAKLQEKKALLIGIIGNKEHVSMIVEALGDRGRNTINGSFQTAATRPLSRNKTARPPSATASKYVDAVHGQSEAAAKAAFTGGSSNHFNTAGVNARPSSAVGGRNKTTNPSSSARATTTAYDHNAYLHEHEQKDQVDLLSDELSSWQSQLMTKLRILGQSRAEALTQRSNVYERGGKVSATIKKGEFKRLQAKYDHLKTLLAMTRNAMAQHKRNVELLKLCRRQTNRGGDPSKLSADEQEVAKGQEMVKNILIVLQEEGPTLMNIDIVHFGATGQRYYDNVDDAEIEKAGYVSPERRRQRQIDDEEEELAAQAEADEVISEMLRRKQAGNNHTEADVRVDSLGNPSRKTVKQPKYPSGSLSPNAPQNLKKKLYVDEQDDNDEEYQYVNLDKDGFFDVSKPAVGLGSSATTAGPTYFSDPMSEWINIGNVKRPIFMTTKDIDAVFANEQLEAHSEVSDEKNIEGDELSLDDKIRKALGESTTTTTAATTIMAARRFVDDKERIHLLLRRVKDLEDERWNDNDHFQKESVQFADEKEVLEWQISDLRSQLQKAHGLIAQLKETGATQKRPTVNASDIRMAGVATNEATSTENEFAVQTVAVEKKKLEEAEISEASKRNNATATTKYNRTSTVNASTRLPSSTATAPSEPEKGPLPLGYRDQSDESGGYAKPSFAPGTSIKTTESLPAPEDGQRRKRTAPKIADEEESSSPPNPYSQTMSTRTQHKGPSYTMPI